MPTNIKFVSNLIENRLQVWAVEHCVYDRRQTVIIPKMIYKLRGLQNGYIGKNIRHRFFGPSHNFPYTTYMW